MLKLGKHVFDVSTQGLVVAPMQDVAMAAFGDKAVDHGASAIYLPASPRPAASVTRFAHVGVPIIAAAHTAEVATKCLAAGASAIDAGVLADPAMLVTIEEAGGSVVITQAAWAGPGITLERARWAESAGLPKSQIIVDVPMDQVSSVARHGYPVMVATHDEDGDQGRHVTAAMAGARLVRSRQTRATKRTLSTVSELLQRRGVSAPNAVELVGTPT